MTRLRLKLIIDWSVVMFRDIGQVIDRKVSGQWPEISPRTWSGYGYLRRQYYLVSASSGGQSFKTLEQLVILCRKSTTIKTGNG